MIPLNEYEARQADEIAAWKSERPSLVMAAFRSLSRPLSQLASRAVPHDRFQALVSKAETMSQRFGGPEEIARLAGVHDIGELRRRPLEECDRLAMTISSPAQREAMIEGAVAGLGGVVTEALNIPILLAAALRSIYRVGYCYGYRLDHETDRLYVLTTLELSAADDPARRQALFEQLKVLVQPEDQVQPAIEQVSLDGVEEDLIEDLAFGVVPILGDVTSILMDYDFIRRVDISARRVFQEALAQGSRQARRDLPRGREPEAKLLRGRHRSGLAPCLHWQLRDRVRRGVSPHPDRAGATGFDNSAARGVKQGAGAATRDAHRFASRLRSAMDAGSATSQSSAELSVSAAS